MKHHISHIVNTWTRMIALSWVMGHWSVSYAQQGDYRYLDAIQLWHLTGNAAGLGLDSMQNRGYALFNAEHQSGDYARVQEGTQTNQLRFQTERYQKVGKYLYGYGRFDFDYGRTKNRAWADVRRPYNSNPFFAGSAVKGKYDFQDFDFTVALGTVAVSGWRFGVGLDYNVGDLSRLRDPRSRSMLLDYKLSPAVTYTTGQHSLGVSGNYHRRKEKITGVTTVQQDATLKYYLMSGMEHAEGIVGGYSSFGREWVDHRFGAELTYAYSSPSSSRHSPASSVRATDPGVTSLSSSVPVTDPGVTSPAPSLYSPFRSLISLTIERGSEDVLGQYKYEPGHFVDYRYGIAVRNRLHSRRLLHQFDLQANYDQAYADEYRQQLQQEKDAQTGYTSYYYTTLLTFKKRYQVKQLQASLHYRLNILAPSSSASCAPASRCSSSPVSSGSLCSDGVAAYLGARLSTADTKNRRLLPESTRHGQAFDLSLEGGRQLFGDRLWLDATVTRHLSTTADLSLSDPTTDYATQVLLPDLPYYEANYWHGHVSLTYHFPLKLKGTQTRWFVRAYGDYLKTNNSLDAKCIGLSVGLYN